MTFEEAWEAAQRDQLPGAEPSQRHAFRLGWNAALDAAKREAGAWGRGRQGMRASDAIIRAIDRKRTGG